MQSTKDLPMVWNGHKSSLRLQSDPTDLDPLSLADEKWIDNSLTKRDTLDMLTYWSGIQETRKPYKRR